MVIGQGRLGRAAYTRRLCFGALPCVLWQELALSFAFFCLYVGVLLLIGAQCLFDDAHTPGGRCSSCLSYPSTLPWCPVVFAELSMARSSQAFLPSFLPSFLPLFFPSFLLSFFPSFVPSFSFLSLRGARVRSGARTGTVYAVLL